MLIDERQCYGYAPHQVLCLFLGALPLAFVLDKICVLQIFHCQLPEFQQQLYLGLGEAVDATHHQSAHHHAAGEMVLLSQVVGQKFPVLLVDGGNPKQDKGRIDGEVVGLVADFTV